MSPSTLFFCGLGILGGILLLFGFYRISSGKWTNKSFWYELDNVLGATFLIIYQVHYGAYVSAVLNIIWGGIALIGILRFSGRYHSYTKRARKKSSRVTRK